MTTKQTTRRARVNPIGEVTASNPVGTRVIASDPDVQSIRNNRDGADHYSLNLHPDECPFHREVIHRAYTGVNIGGCLVDRSSIEFIGSFGGEDDGK
jgi:hypothetical protein